MQGTLTMMAQILAFKIVITLTGSIIYIRLRTRKKVLPGGTFSYFTIILVTPVAGKVVVKVRSF